MSHRTGQLSNLVYRRQVPTDRSSVSRPRLGVEFLNLAHRILRALYLQFGPREGPGSLDPVPFGVVVYSAKSDAVPPLWVEVLASELQDTPSAPHEFGFSADVRDLRLLPRAEIFFVDRDIATAFFSAVGGNVRSGQYFVVSESEGRESVVGPQGELVLVVSMPERGGAKEWLEQFS